MTGNTLFFILFVFTILGILLFDLLIIGKKSHEVSLREAAIWTTVWISLALGFSVFLLFFGDFVHGIESKDDLQLVLDHYYPYLTPFQGTLDEGLQILTWHSILFRDT